MPDKLEALRDILQDALGIKVPITDAEAVAARLAELDADQPDAA